MVKETRPALTLSNAGQAEDPCNTVDHRQTSLSAKPYLLASAIPHGINGL
jgi:hypothetical protein